MQLGVFAVFQENTQTAKINLTLFIERVYDSIDKEPSQVSFAVIY